MLQRKSRNCWTYRPARWARFLSYASAEAYWTSFPMKLMKKRAVPESLSYEIEEIEFDKANPL
jgi:hypothetical protein